MSIAKAPTSLALSKGFIDLQDQYMNNIMDVRTTPPKDPINRIIPQRSKGVAHFVEGRKVQLDYCKAGHGGRTLFRYFPLESLWLLICLTISLLILPLILPPLPPPPSLLLLLPICILVLLMFLAFMPSNARDATYSYT